MLDSGTLSNTGLLTVTGGYWGSGRLALGGTGGDVVDSGVLNNTGTIVLTGSQGSDQLPGYLPGYGATLAVSGVLINGGTIEIGGGVGPDNRYALMDITGQVANNGSIVLQGGQQYRDFGATLVNAGTLSNAGAIYIGAGPAAQALLLNATTGLLIDKGTITGNGVLENQGRIITPHGSAAAIATPHLVNDGTISVASDAGLRIAGAITADAGRSGVIDLAANAALTLAGSVTDSQSIAFSSGDTLTLANAAGFAGVLDGLAAGDTLDLAGLDAQSVATAGTLLQVALSNGALAFSLGAELSGVAFQVSSDNAGGTDVTLLSTMAATLPDQSGLPDWAAPQAPATATLAASAIGGDAHTGPAGLGSDAIHMVLPVHPA